MSLDVDYQVNIVAVFLSVAFWGWPWGLPGALMAVPILVFINVLCEQVDLLKPFGHFITGRTILPEPEPGSNPAGSS
jgi:predicted PurR-regulated permease PerM